MEIQLFNSPKFGAIRTAGTPEHPTFCLADVCRILDLDTSQVMKRLADGVVTIHPTQDALGRIQQTKFVNESGLYKTIFQSRKPEAEAFTAWVTDEVLPSIRMTGGYIPVAEQDTEQDILAKAVIIAQKSLEERDRRIKALEGQKELLRQENAILAPKAQYADEVLQSKDTYTHTEMAKELNFKSWKALIDACKADGIIFKQSGIYMLYAKYAGKGYMKTRTTPYQRSDGSVGTNTISVWTEEGRRFLHEHFNVAMKPVDLTMFDLTQKDI